MAKKNRGVTLTRAFMVLEATTYHGGFPAFMNDRLTGMRQELQLEGHYEEPVFSFEGGDGVTVPVVIRATIGG
jgi:hypothetical protein